MIIIITSLTYNHRQNHRQLTVDPVLVEADHPVQAFQLVVAHRPELDAVRLLSKERRLTKK